MGELLLARNVHYVEIINAEFFARKDHQIEIVALLLRIRTESHYFDTLLGNTVFMKRTIYLIAVLGLGAFPASLHAAFYDDAEKFPVLESLTFVLNHVGLQIARYDYGRYPLPPLIHSRSDNKMSPVSEDRFLSIFGDDIDLLPNPRRPQELTYETTNGTPYTRPTCYPPDQVVSSQMTIADEPFDIEFSGCVSVSEIELTGDLVVLQRDNLVC